MITTDNDRRAFLKIAGGSALLIPLVGISACSKQEPVAATVTDSTPAVPVQPVPVPAPAPVPQAEPAQPVAGSAAAPPGNLPHLDPGDPVARALAYHADTSTVDAVKYPRHLAGQACRKCLQFKGGAGDAWGPCTLFVGKQVNGNGWCTAFAARA